MPAPRAFYVTQGSLTVWSNERHGEKNALRFADSDDGLRKFDEYLGTLPEQPSFMLVDVIEEEFAVDSIPKLGIRDRKSLLTRRIERKYPRTRYRIPIYQAKGRKKGGEARVTFCAITNHELVDPWLRVILRHRTPLTGLYSVPLMAGRLLGRLFDGENPTLFVTQHQYTKLRQVFVEHGYTGSARLSESPPHDDPGYAQFVVTETQRSRRYLERTRLIAHMQQLDVCVLADEATANEIRALVDLDGPTEYHFVDPIRAAKRIGLATPLRPDCQEYLYVAAASRSRPAYNYAISGEKRYWTMRRVRHAISASLMATAAAASVIAGIYASDAMFLKYQIHKVESQVAQLSETFRRENESFDYRADSHEMKFAVDTGNFLLSNRLPVPWVMQQVGLVMGTHPGVRIQNLSWEAMAAVDPNARPAQRDTNMPVPIPEVREVQAEIEGELMNFEGDMRKAFADIDRLVADLEEKTAFTHVVAIEYPLDASPQAAISGEIVTKGRQQPARFRIRMTFPVGAVDDQEVDDDPV
ncbi:MAG: hypothetical protein QNJ07_16130 [Woeseiaceae bacterium]|nr:hypothetical protein [Woeseiaceae bacterium]